MPDRDGQIPLVLGRSPSGCPRRREEAEDVFGGVLAQVEFAVRGELRVASRDRAAITYEKLFWSVQR